MQEHRTNDAKMNMKFDLELRKFTRENISDMFTVFCSSVVPDYFHSFTSLPLTLPKRPVEGIRKLNASIWIGKSSCLV
jgi:hypothetical protein